MNITLQLESKAADRYRRVFASLPELTLLAGDESRIETLDQSRPLRVLPRPAAGSDLSIATQQFLEVLPAGTVGLVAARAIPFKERETLEAAGLSWCDGRGAIHLFWPGVLIHIDHSERRRTVNDFSTDDGPRLGPAGIRAVQVLLDGTTNEWTVNLLAERARISVGQAHNVFRIMERNRLVHSIGKGPQQRRVINDRGTSLDWLADEDRSRRRPRAAATYIYGRTDQEVVQRFALRAAEAGINYAVTGAAASLLLGVSVLNRILVTEIRVSGLEVTEALARLGLERLDADEAGRGMNLDLWTDTGELGTFGASQVGDIRIAPPVRVWLDLLRKGGRYQDAAQLFREQTLDRA